MYGEEFHSVRQEKSSPGFLPNPFRAPGKIQFGFSPIPYSGETPVQVFPDAVPREKSALNFSWSAGMGFGIAGGGSSPPVRDPRGRVGSGSAVGGEAPGTWSKKQNSLGIRRGTQRFPRPRSRPARPRSSRLCRRSGRSLCSPSVPRPGPGAAAAGAAGQGPGS